MSSFVPRMRQQTIVTKWSQMHSTNGMWIAQTSIDELRFMNYSKSQRQHLRSMRFVLSLMTWLLVPTSAKNYMLSATAYHGSRTSARDSPDKSICHTCIFEPEWSHLRGCQPEGFAQTRHNSIKISNSLTVITSIYTAIYTLLAWCVFLICPLSI